MNTHKIFVYGSLKKGYGNNRLLSDAKFIGNDTTVDKKFTLMCWGAFPAVYYRGSDAIQGELYEVDESAFDSVDRLEGFPHFYNRLQVELESGNTAWMYFIKDEEPRGKYCEDGLWNR